MGKLCEKKQDVFAKFSVIFYNHHQGRLTGEKKEGQKKGEEGGRGGGRKPERDRRETKDTKEDPWKGP